MAKRRGEQVPERRPESWQCRVGDVVRRVDDLLERRGSGPGDGGPDDPDQPARALYAEIELLRMDYEAAAGERASAELVAALEEQRGRLAIRTPDRGGRVGRAVWFAYLLARFAVVGLYFLLWVPVLLVLGSLRVANPALRRLGCRNNWLPNDIVQKLFNSGVTSMMGATVYVEGRPRIPVGHNSVILYSHSSNIDPFVIGSGPLSFKYIYKSDLNRLPCLALPFKVFGHIAIDRKDRESAVRSLKDAAGYLHRWGRSLAIAPEGTRSRTGRIADFKKGPFHVAVGVRLPLTPVLVIGSADVWPRDEIFSSPGSITVRFLEPIAPDEGADHNALLARSRRAMLEAYGAPLAPAAKRDRFYPAWHPLVAHALIAAFYAASYGALSLLF